MQLRAGVSTLLQEKLQSSVDFHTKRQILSDDKLHFNNRAELKLPDIACSAKPADTQRIADTEDAEGEEEEEEEEEEEDAEGDAESGSHRPSTADARRSPRLAFPATVKELDEGVFAVRTFRPAPPSCPAPAPAMKTMKARGRQPREELLRHDNSREKVQQEREKAEWEMLIDVLANRHISKAKSLSDMLKLGSTADTPQDTFDLLRNNSTADDAPRSPIRRGARAPSFEEGHVGTTLLVPRTPRAVFREESSSRSFRVADKERTPRRPTKRKDLDTCGTYPLLPSSNAVKTDVRFAMCNIFTALRKCPRGIHCPFVHSPKTSRENMRRVIMKVRTQIDWARGLDAPRHYHDVDSLMWDVQPLPPPMGFIWSDDQVSRLPDWVLEKPSFFHPDQYVVDLAAEIVKHAGIITSFELRKCPLRPKALLALCEALLECRELCSVRFSYTDITDACAIVVADFIDSHPRLDTLALDYGNIGPKGTAMLCKVLQTCRPHFSLSLHGNPVGDEGAAALARLLQVSGCGLSHLDLSFSMIGDGGITSLARSLKSNTTLTALHLDAIHCTMTGCLALYQAMKINTSVDVLTLRYVRATSVSYLSHLTAVLQDNQQRKRRKEMENVSTPHNKRHPTTAKSCDPATRAIPIFSGNKPKCATSRRPSYRSLRGSMAPDQAPALPPQPLQVPSTYKLQKKRRAFV